MNKNNSYKAFEIQDNNLIDEVLRGMSVQRNLPIKEDGTYPIELYRIVINELLCSSTMFELINKSIFKENAIKRYYLNEIYELINMEGKESYKALFKKIYWKIHDYYVCGYDKE